jgi:hypothetical protein
MKEHLHTWLNHMLTLRPPYSQASNWTWRGKEQFCSSQESNPGRLYAAPTPADGTCSGNPLIASADQSQLNH